MADAGMVSEVNRKGIEDAGLSFILGARIPEVPYVVTAWRREYPDIEPADGQIFTQPWPVGPPTTAATRSSTTVQGRPGPARPARHRRPGRQAEKAVAGKIPVKRNRFVQLACADKSVNRTLEAKARALAGFKGYITNIDNPTPEFVVDAYHRLYNIEKSFRISKHDLAARPIYHHKRESIDAHLTIVFAALAVTRHIEDRTDWSIRRFVHTARHYRTIHI